MANFVKMLSSLGRKSAVPQVECLQFDSAALDDSFNSLQTVLQETSRLANAISSTLESREIVDRKLSTILQVISDGIIVKDAEGNWTYLNDSAKNLYHFKCDHEWKDLKDEEIGMFRPDLHELFRKTCAYDIKAWESGKPFYSEETIMCHDVLHTYSVVRTPLFINDGSRNCLIYVARDVTELTETRRNIYVAYKALNASSDLISIIDEDGNIVFANDSFARMYKYIDPRDLIGKNMSILRSPHFSDETYQKLWATIKAGRVWHHQIINLDRYGNEVKVTNTILPVVDQELNTPFFICIGVVR